MTSQAIEGADVVIIAERPLINPNATSEVHVRRSEDIKYMPIKGYENIVATEAGVVKVGRDLHIRGSRAEEVAYYVDGVYMNNAYTLSRTGDVITSSIEEVSFQAGGFGAEYGSANGGVINTTTKSGSNDFKVNMEFFTDDFLNQDNDNKLGTYGYGRRQANLALSGPLMGDKMKFYVAGEYEFREDKNPTSAPHIGLVDPDDAFDMLEATIWKLDPGDKIRQKHGMIYEHNFSVWDPLEEFTDENGNGKWDEGEPFDDRNGNGVHDYNTLPTDPILMPRYDEDYTDENGNGKWDEGEPFDDFNGNGTRDLAVSIISGAELFGPRPNNDMERFKMNGNVLIDLTPIRLRVGGSVDNRTERSWVAAYDLFNSANMPRRESQTVTGYLNMTHQLNQNTLYKLTLNYFKDEEKAGDDRFWEDFENYGDKSDWNNDGIYNSWLNDAGIRRTTATNAFANYSLVGRMWNDYRHTISSHIGLTGSLISQRENHELKIGGEFRRNTVRFFRMGRPLQLSDAFTRAIAAGDTLNDGSLAITRDANVVVHIDPGFEERIYQAAYAENIGFNYKGELIGDDLLGEDAARKPINAALYIQDLIELDDLNLNIGIRWDYLEPVTKRFRAADSIVLVDGKIDSDQNLIEGTTHSFISPRIGVGFPVTEKTVFHAQYGKYFQQPELRRLFISYTRLANNLQAGNFTVSGNPSLKPEEQTQYEVGIQQQIGQNSSIDLTGFYREMRDYVQIRTQNNNAGTDYSLFVNGDYGTVKGMTFTFNLRRTSNITAHASYTYQIAAGTGSDANTQFRAAWQDSNFPTYISPLDFDQRHTGNINVDYRVLDGSGFMNNAGVNFLYRFGSGMPYTPVEINSYIFGNNTQFPKAGINSAHMPWTYQLDMKINKVLSLGNANLDVYLWVVNLLDTRNVTDVFDGTGLPNEDGYFSTQLGRNYADNNPEGKNMYQVQNNYQNTVIIDTPANWSEPRQILLGVIIDL